MTHTTTTQALKINFIGRSIRIQGEEGSVQPRGKSWRPKIWAQRISQSDYHFYKFASEVRHHVKNKKTLFLQVRVAKVCFKKIRSVWLHQSRRLVSRCHHALTKWTWPFSFPPPFFLSKVVKSVFLFSFFPQSLNPQQNGWKCWNPQ